MRLSLFLVLKKEKWHFSVTTIIYIYLTACRKFLREIHVEMVYQKIILPFIKNNREVRTHLTNQSIRNTLSLSLLCPLSVSGQLYEPKSCCCFASFFRYNICDVWTHKKCVFFSSFQLHWESKRNCEFYDLY